MAIILQNQVIPDSSAFEINGSGIVVTYLNGLKKVFSYDSVAIANNVMAGIQASYGVTTAVLLDINPKSFDITTAFLQVTGMGFNQGLTDSSGFIGQLFFENGGFPDSNGYRHDCIFTTVSQMNTQYSGPGDGVLDSINVIIYFRDNNGVNSNWINATNPSGTLITIP